MRYRQRSAETRAHQITRSRRIGKTLIHWRSVVRLPTSARLSDWQLRTNHSKREHSDRRLNKSRGATIRETKNHLLGSNSHDQKHVIGQIDETKFK
jgi:hypothetical protein